ncbi:NAD(+) hydrolase sarm1 [Dinochytrium kinnereticum]|nr:NAD(+) hydrolase sarm1 [Dinochytrium kinnereticum]
MADHSFSRPSPDSVGSIDRGSQEQPREPPQPPVVPPRRLAAGQVEADIVTHLKRSLQKMEEALRDRQTQITKLKGIIDKKDEKKAKALNPTDMIDGPYLTGDEVSALRMCLSVHEEEDQPQVPEEALMSMLRTIDGKLKKRIESENGLLSEIKTRISDRERSWQDQSSSSEDDIHELKRVAWSDWPISNSNGERHYKFDYFISYRVSSESNLARELRLELTLRGKTVFLDQEELKDGEDWRKGFVTGLKRSKVVILLISQGCVERMKGSSHQIDNVLLEWETALYAQEMGFCHVVPIYVGKGQLDFKDYPTQHANLSAKDSDSDMACQQSAFSTLSQVKRIARCHYLPFPREGCEGKLIDDLVEDLREFDKLYEKTILKRSILTFCELSTIETFKLRFGDPKDIVQMWQSDSLQLNHVQKRNFEKVKSMLEFNKSWKNFKIEERGKLEDLVAILKLIVAKDPTLIHIQGCGFESHAVATELFQMISEIPSITNIQVDGKGPCLEESTFEALMKGLKNTCVHRLELMDLFIQTSSLSIHTRDFLKGNETLTYMDFSGNYIQDADMQIILEGLSGNKIIKTLKLDDSGVTESGLVQLWLTLKSTNVETLEISSRNEGSMSSTQAVNSFVEYISTTSTLKNLVLGSGCFLGPIENITVASRAFAGNKSIISLGFLNTKLDSESLEILVESVRKMNQLESIDISGNALRDESLESSIRSLFSMKSLKSFSLDDDEEFGDFGASIIADCVERGTNVIDISLQRTSISSEGVLAIASAARETKSLSKLRTLCEEQVIRSLLEAHKASSGNLKLMIDYPEELNLLVRNEYILPVLFTLNGIIETESHGDTSNVGEKPQTFERSPSVMKSEILKLSLQLSEIEKDLSYFRTILSAVERVDTLFNKSTVTHNHHNFRATWPFPLEDPEPSVLLLTRVIDNEQCISDTDNSIIREIGLRLKVQKLEDRASWMKVGDEDGGEENEEEVEDSASFVEGTRDQRQKEDIKIFVRKSHYPAVKFFNGFHLYNLLQFSPIRHVDIGDVTRNFPGLVVVFLSESILSDLSSNEDKLWAAINAWDFLMRSAEESYLTVLPVFLASNGEGGKVIGNMISILQHALYLWTVNPNKSIAVGTNEELGKEIARAFDTINRLFKLQGVRVDNFKQVPDLVEKMVIVSRTQSRRERLMEYNVLKKFKEMPELALPLGRSLQSGTFNLECDITDRNVELLESFLPLPFFKKFEGRLGEDKETTSIEALVISTLKKCSALESISIDGLQIGMTDEATDSALVTLAKFLKRSRLEFLDLRMNITSGKAASQFAHSLKNHPTLKQLHLFGFSQYYAKDIALILAENKVLQALTLSASALAKNTSLNTLELGYCSLENQNLEWLVNGLLLNRSVANLNLRGNVLTPEGAKHIARLLEKSSTITNLNMSTHHEFVPLEDGLDSIFDTLTSNQHLTSLTLKGRQFSASNINAFIITMAKNTVLENIDIEGCAIAASDMAKIVAVMSRAKQIKQAILSGNRCEERVISEVITWIRKNGSLSGLGFQGVEMSDESLSAFFSAITSNTNLRFISMNPSITIPQNVLGHMSQNEVRSRKESSAEAWQFAISNRDADSKAHLIQLLDATDYLSKEAQFLVNTACQHGDLDLMSSYLANVPIDVLEGANSIQNTTPLGLAMEEGHIDIVKFLLERGVSPVAQKEDTTGAIRIPAFYFAAGIRGDTTMAEVVITMGKDVDPDEVVEDSYSETKFTRRGFTALHKASLNGYHAAVKYLLTKIHNPMTTDAFGSTALHSAARGQISANDLGKDKETSNSGFWPFGRAINRVDHSEVIRLLVDAGLDLNAVDKKGRTAHDVAVQKSRPELAALVRGNQVQKR